MISKANNRIAFILAVIIIGLSGIILFLIWNSGNSNDIKSWGTLEAVELDVRSKIGGKIKKIEVKEGDLVSEGQILGLIDVPELFARRKAAYARHDLAQAEWKRMKRLHAEGIISESTLDKARSSLREAESQKDLIDSQIEDAVIVAPIAGTILEKLAEEGEIIREGTTLFTIADLKRMTLKIYLPGNEVGRIRLKDPAYVKIDAYPKERFKGTVAFIASKAEFTPKYVKTEQEQAAQVFEVKIDLPNPEGKLKPGLPANVTLERK